MTDRFQRYKAILYSGVVGAMSAYIWSGWALLWGVVIILAINLIAWFLSFEIWNP